MIRREAIPRQISTRLKTSGAGPGSAWSFAPDSSSRGRSHGPEELEKLFPFLKPLKSPEWDFSPETTLSSARSVTDFEDLLSEQPESDTLNDVDFDARKWGLFLLILSGTVFVIGLYAAVFSKFVEPTGIWVGTTNRFCCIPSPLTLLQILDWIAGDNYYSYLVPLTLPVAVILMVINWVGFKVFRHN